MSNDLTSINYLRIMIAIFLLLYYNFSIPSNIAFESNNIMLGYTTSLATKVTIPKINA